MLRMHFLATLLLYYSIISQQSDATPIGLAQEDALAKATKTTTTTTTTATAATKDNAEILPPLSDNVAATLPAPAALSAKHGGGVGVEAIGATSLAAAAGAAAAMVNAAADVPITTAGATSTFVVAKAVGTATTIDCGNGRDGDGGGGGNNDGSGRGDVDRVSNTAVHGNNDDDDDGVAVNASNADRDYSKPKHSDSGEAVSLAGAGLGSTTVAGTSSIASSATSTTQAPKIPRYHGQRNNDDDADNGILSSSANLLLEPAANLINLTRQHDGDVFRTTGVQTCNADTCVGLSSGTAGLDLLSSAGDKSVNTVAVVHSTFGEVDLLSKRSKLPKPSVANDANESCQCRCLNYLSTYREDLGICVDDIHECTLSPFVSGSSTEKIPFVFLPLRGQIIYPSREISFPDIRTPVCAVTGAQFLTINGWTDLRNPIDSDYPFRMFRDEGRTFLQWLGEPDLRQKMQGRLIVVHLVCRDMTFTLNATRRDHFMPPKNVFSPCVAFRVNGSPVKYTPNVSEVLFQAEATATAATPSAGMTTKEYVVIGICSLLLGLIYVASVFLYLHMKKRKSGDQSTPHMRNSLDDIAAANEINYPKNDQVTFGAPFNRSGSIYSVSTNLGTSGPNEPRSRASIVGSLKEEMGIIKNNPLLQHFPQLGEHNSGFASDISNSNSECEMDGAVGGGFHHDKLKQMQTSALVHPQMGMNSGNNSSGSGNGNGNGCGNGSNNNNNNRNNNGNGSNGNRPHNSPNNSPKNANAPCNSNGGNNNHSGGEHLTHDGSTSSSPTQETECLPVGNVSIVEDMMTEEKLEHLRQMVNGNVRKKLYFNPAYFEPHLLAQPPPAAIEFLHKIREVIAIAKYKMATKRYQPSLIMIPEEGTVRSETPSMYGSNRQQQQQTTSSSECQGCANNRCSGHVKNCGDKRNSIEKWLQTVTSNEELAESNERTNGTAASTAREQSEHSERTNKQQQQPHTQQQQQMQQQQQQKQQQKQQQQQQQQQPQHSRQQQTNFNGSSRHQQTASSSNSSPSRNNRPHSRSSQRSQAGRKDVALAQPKQRPLPPPTTSNDGGGGCANATNDTRNIRHAAALHAASVNAIEVMPSKSSVSYQLYCTSISTGPSVTIPITHNHTSYSKTVSALTAAASLYGFAETGSEIYNNPKFTLNDSPPATPQRSRRYAGGSKSSAAQKRYEGGADVVGGVVCDQALVYHQQYDLLRKQMHILPESMYDALNREYHMNNGFHHFDIPTPDYDSTIEKKAKDIYNKSGSSSMPSVPTPDYSTLSRKSLKQMQPDSPVYRRKSPQYLIVDYETDSLERLEATKRKCSHSSSSPSSEQSSQLSPSLSTALPLEEELEISHTVFDKTNGFHAEDELKQKTNCKSESSSGGSGSKQKEIAARIKYDTPFLGSMTIEVEHEPQSDMERSTDSDQFEPDTLDRKPKKQSFCDLNEWQGVKNSCAAATEQATNHASIILRSASSFRSQSSQGSSCSQTYGYAAAERPDNEDLERVRPSISALRDIYQSPLLRQNSHNSQRSQTSCKCGARDVELDSEEGRLLTLEAKQKRRQQIVESPPPPPPPTSSATTIDISREVSKDNKTTITITTPKIRRTAEAAVVNPQLQNGGRRSTSPQPQPPPPTQTTHAQPAKKRATSPSPTKIYALAKNVKTPPTCTSPTPPANPTHSPTPAHTPNSTISTNGTATNSSSKASSLSSVGQKKRIARSPPQLPPPPPPPSSASTTLTSQRSHASTQHSPRSQHSHTSSRGRSHHYQNQQNDNHYQHSQHQHHHHHHHHYVHHDTTSTNATTTEATEDETTSNHSESTEVTGVSDNFGGSCNNTLTSVAGDKGPQLKAKLDTADEVDEERDQKKSPRNSAHTIETGSDHFNGDKADVELLKSAKQTAMGSPTPKIKSAQHIDGDPYGSMFNTHINGLRNDYSLTKYMNRRKSQDHTAAPAAEDEQTNGEQQSVETNNNINANAKMAAAADVDGSKLDLISIGSRSNRSSSRLSDRTKDMYRNAGVPVGIAYPQRSTASATNNSNNSNNSANGTPSTPPTSQAPRTPPAPASTPTNTIQTVYHCEIEPLQLTHGMQIAMGLKDRAKKAKDLKNAWKKFVSMAASKFSPTHSPAPSYAGGKKTPPLSPSANFLEALVDRDEGISSLIVADDHHRNHNHNHSRSLSATPKSSYSAPASQNYYEQRFGPRPQEMDSGYMSADSSEMYKRSFYDRYNFRKMSGRDRIIRVDTIEDNSDGDGSTLTDRHNGEPASARRGSILLDSNRFEDLENIGGEPPPEHGGGGGGGLGASSSAHSHETLDSSDAESDKTLTQSSAGGGHSSSGGRSGRGSTRNGGVVNAYSSSEEEEHRLQRRRGHSPCYGSSETDGDGDTNAEDMWESGAESIETHSVLYKIVRKS